MIIKKYAGIIPLILVIVFLLAGCGKNKNAGEVNQAQEQPAQEIENQNTDQEIQLEEIKKEDAEESKEELAAEAAKISLSGKKTSKGVSLSWSVQNLGSFDGFKIVKSKEANPVYPKNDYKNIDDNAAHSYDWKFTSGSKYHFRVCKYVGDKCVLYSNDITLDTPEKEDASKGTDNNSDEKKLEACFKIDGTQVNKDTYHYGKISLDASCSKEADKYEWTITETRNSKSHRIGEGKICPFKILDRNGLQDLYLCNNREAKVDLATFGHKGYFSTVKITLVISRNDKKEEVSKEINLINSPD